MTPESTLNKNEAIGPERPAAAEQNNLESKIEDFAKMNPAEKAERIASVLDDKAELANAYKDIELEVAGGRSNLKEKVTYSLLEKVGIWWDGGRESKKGQEIEFRKIAEIAHIEAEKKLSVIERIDGRRLIDSKTASARKEKDNLTDLENIKNFKIVSADGKEEAVYSEEELSAKKSELDSERAQLRGTISENETNLQEKLTPYSEIAETKRRELTESTQEYQGYYDNVAAERKVAEKNLARYQKLFDSLKSSGPAMDKNREEIRQAIEKHQENKNKLIACEDSLKKRLDAVKANKSQVDAYLERINRIGKTDADLRKEREAKEAERRAREAQTRPKTGAETGGEDLEELDELAGQAAGEPVESEEDAGDDGEEEAAAGPVEKQPETDRLVELAEQEAIKQERRARKISRIDLAANEGLAAERVAPEARPAGDQRDEQGQEQRETAAPPVSHWLSRIFKIRLGDAAYEVIKKHFKSRGAPFMKTAPMTLNQALRAYAGFQEEFKRKTPAAALATAKKHFERIFKNESDILREIGPVESLTASPETTELAAAAPEPVKAQSNQENKAALGDLERGMDEALAQENRKAEIAPKSAETPAETVPVEPARPDQAEPINQAREKTNDEPSADKAIDKPPVTAPAEKEAAPVKGSKKAEKQAEIEAEQAFSIKEWLGLLGIDKVNKQVRDNFRWSDKETKFKVNTPITRSQAEKAGINYLMSTGIPEDTAKKIVRDKIK